MGDDLRWLRLRADWDHNLSIQLADYQLFTSHYGQNVTPWSNSDANGDGIVNLYDFAILHATYGLVAVTDPPPQRPRHDRRPVTIRAAAWLASSIASGLKIFLAFDS